MRTPFNIQLRERRRAKKLTREDLAQKLSVTPETIWKWESLDLKRGITLYNAARIALILDWDLVEMAAMTLEPHRFLPPKEKVLKPSDLK